MKEACNLCPNLCGVCRTAGGKGLCLASDQMVVNRAALHFFEEPPISGTRGSGTIFFGGCTLKCVFCQNRAISRVPQGKTYTYKALADLFRRLEDEGAHNINLVTPTHYSEGIKRALDIYRPRLPIVYNTSGYELAEVVHSLNDYVDIYLTDFKYADKSLAKELSGRENYPRYAQEALGEMLGQKTNRYDEDGIMQEGVIVRHLVLPGEINNSIEVLKLLKNNFGTDIALSLMSQFTPIPECTRIARRLKPLEYKAVVSYAIGLGFQDIFIQETDSATTEYIPDFDISE